MNINIVYSGYVRTLFHSFPITVSTIRNIHPNAKINVFGSFWKTSYGRSDRLNDPWHFVVENYQQNIEDLTQDGIECRLTNLDSSIHTIKVEFIDTLIQKNLYNEGTTIGLSPAHMMCKFYLTKKSIDLVPNVQGDSLFLITRPDVILNRFPCTKDVKDSELILSKYGWYMAEGRNGFENEMMWIATNRQMAEKTCDIISALRHEKIPKEDMFAESVYGRYFHQLTSKISRFDFDYRIPR